MKKKLVCSLIIVLLLGSGVFTYEYQQLPAFLSEREVTSQKITFLDRHQKIIRAYIPHKNHEVYDWVSLDKIPADLIRLIIMAEDQHFFTHAGIDYKGAARSIWLNLKKWQVVSGASTISQQAYRLSHSLPRTRWGKIQTMIGAMKIENYYSKNKILEFYLNNIPYGKDLMGVKRAAEVYFGKDLNLLTLAEMATMAVLPRSPSRLFHNTDHQLLKLRNSLITKYAEHEKIGQDILQFELKLPLELKKDLSGWDNYHYVNRVIKHPNFNQFVSSEGVVQTTLDHYLQKEVLSIIHARLEDLKHLDVHQAAAIVIDNKNGDILAYGNSNNTYFDALSIKRQPGSALKPLTYALALQNSFTLATPLPDIPSYYKTGLGQFLPRNYDKSHSGPRLAREALANSLNLPAVALADELGVEKVYQFFQSMGLTLEKSAANYGVGLTLGNAEITPFELAGVYTAFAREGIKISPRFFAEEQVRETPTPLTPESAFLISHALQDNVARREEFGQHNPFDLPFTFSVKTGTSTDFRDNWAIGFNKKFTILVWVGNIDQKPMKKVSGITGAGPILADIAKLLAKNIVIPRLVANANVEAHTICALSGKKPGIFCSHTKEEFFLKGSFKNEICDFHQEAIVHDCHTYGDNQKINLALLPAQYQSFVNDTEEWQVKSQVAKVCTLDEVRIIAMNTIDSINEVHITRPLPNSIYAFDPNIPAKLQKLRLELNQFSEIKKVQWKLDGQALQPQPTNAIYNWPLKRGKFQFEAEVEFVDGHKVKTPILKVSVL